MSTPSRKQLPQHRGLFITFEGTEGAGKSTLIRTLGTELAKRLLSEGLGESSVVTTREPGGTPVAEQIRKTILDHEMSPWTELFLYEAARAEHLAVTILPALRSNKIVLCDRFTDSSLAYQAHARGLEWKTVKQLNAIATQGLTPDATVLIDIDPAVGLERAQDKNRFEEEGLRFQIKVRAGFLKSRGEKPSRWIVIKPGTKTPEELAHEVMKKLQKKLNAWAQSNRQHRKSR
jgi:dTMP kinase